MSKAVVKEISQIKIQALELLVKSGKISLNDIKDVDYQRAVETALNKQQ